MKKQKRIFTGFLTSALFVLFLAPAAFAAADTSCDDENNEYINQRLALCSVHAYNIGATENPTDIAQQQAIKDVVALKTTIMTQQMKKQYDFLEVTVRRFKTQLEKAILVSKMEAAGAGSESSASGQSTDKNVVLNGAENCLLKNSTAEGRTCIQNNLRLVVMAVDSGNTGQARNQLTKDLSFANSYGITAPDNCKSYSDKMSVTNCANSLRIAVITASEKATQRNGGGYNNTMMQQ